MRALIARIPVVRLVFRRIALPLLVGSTLGNPAPAAAQLSPMTATASQSPATVRPGFADVTLFTLNIQNPNLLGVTLRSVTLTNQTFGPGSTVAQRDLELGNLRLFRDDGDQNPDSLGQTAASGGKATFSSLNVAIGGLGGSVRLFVVTNIPLLARDGDILDLGIPDQNGLTFQSGTWSGFPLDPPGGFPVDGMVAAQISLLPTKADSILAGSQDVLALDVVLPSNGYAADVLQDLAVVNEGTAVPGSDLTGMRAWADDGDAKFNPASDRSLGSLVFTGSRWQVTGLTEPVPSGGLHVFLSVSVSDLAAQGRTVRLGIPAAPSEGIGMASGNDGPLDTPVRNPAFRVISAADRITFTATPVPAATARPGDSGVLLLNAVASNSYVSTRVLTGLTVTNATVGPGSQTERDHEARQIALRADGNGDGLLGNPGTDPVLGIAVFQDGRGVFDGLSWPIPSGQSTRLFVTASVSLEGASDSDMLALVVADPLHVNFTEPTRVAAVWPLDSGARATIDGMVAAQVTNVGAPTATAGPSDGPLLALDAIVPRNGYAADVLNAIAVVNRGDAGLTDVAELRLWRDGGDGAFTPGSGDDRDLGSLTWQAGAWRSNSLVEALPGTGARLFVGLTVSGSPRDSATVRLAIPVGGLATQSANDGPIDAEIGNPETITISNAPLLATLSTANPGSSIGQQVAVSMVVRNTSGESVNGIRPSPLTTSGGGTLSYSSGPTPPTIDLAVAGTDTFRWSYTATAPGDVVLLGSAQGTGSPSGTTRRSLEASSNTHRVYETVSSIDYTAASSMPATVSRGQSDVVPLNLTFTHTGGADAAPVRLLGLRIRLEDGAGNGIVPSDLLTGVTVGSGTTIHLRKTTLETSGAEVALTLASPALVAGGQSIGLSMRVDVSTSATAPNFRVVISDSTWLDAADANSGAPVSARLQGSSYTIRSSLARLVSEATRLDVAAAPSPPGRAGRGEAAIPLLTLRVENPGLSGITSDVRISSFDVGLTDTNGLALTRPSEHLGRIRVTTAFQELTDRVVFATDGASLTLVLSPALSVPVNTPLDLFILGDVAPDAKLGPFRIELGDSASFDVRDAGTGSRVPAFYASDPISGSSVTVEETADSLAVRGTPRLPPQVTIGKTGVASFTATFRHPGPAGTARIRVDSLVVQVRNESRQPLAPSTYLSRLRIDWNGVEAANRPDPPSTGGSVAMALSAPLLEPGDSAVVELWVDVSPAAPSGYLELMVFDAGIRAVDDNLGLPAAVVADGGAELPITSGLTRLVPPARELVADLEDRMPAALAADGDTVTVGVLTLENAASTSSDSIFVDNLVLRASDQGFAALPIGSAASRVFATSGGSPWAESGALSSDSTLATLLAGSPVSVPPGERIDLELHVVLRRDAGWRTLRIGCDAAGVGVIQPGSAVLEIQVQPAPGRAFPMWTGAGSVSALTLRESYSNFPNPFAAGRARTSFAYYLGRAGRVTLRIFAPNGEPVATLVEDGGRPAGMNQGDSWDGRNGKGSTVRNGVYIAELAVSFDDGTKDRVLRKVAVVR